MSFEESNSTSRDNEHSSQRSCFLYLCRSPSENDFVKLAKLKDEISCLADLFVLSFAPDRLTYTSPSFPRGLSDVTHYIVDYSAIKSCLHSYTNKVSLSHHWKLIPGNVDIPLIHFFYSHPDYDYYWLMEDDVVFTGDMADLLRNFSSSASAILATNIRPPPHGWGHTHTLKHPGLDQVNQVIGFFPFYRVSNSFLRLADQCYKQGWSGHHEIVWPTMALHFNMPVEDIGGCGDYTMPNNINKYYTSTLRSKNLSPGTFCFYPPKLFFRSDAARLYHPIKPLSAYINSHRSFFRNRIYSLANLFRWYLSRIVRR